MILRTGIAALVLATTFLHAPAALSSTAAFTQTGHEWDEARMRAANTRSVPAIAQAIDRWRQLSASNRFSFGDYADFLLRYPGFPLEDTLRGYAEKALERDGTADSSLLIRFFNRFAPVTNSARARYAVALSATRGPEARTMATEAWRGGAMNAGVEATLRTLYAGTFTPTDHDARMDALLWMNDVAGASRQLPYVSPGARQGFADRLALAQGAGMASANNALASGDAGYLYSQVQQLRKGSMSEAVRLLANRAPLSSPARFAQLWVSQSYAVAKSASASNAVRIAAAMDDAFPAGTDISQLSFRLRDDYTSLMWLAGTQALWVLRDGRQAAPLFYRYGAAAKTPQTRSKGFYWAGLAMTNAGDAAAAQRYYEMAAQYPDYFYGLLAMERLNRPVPSFNGLPSRKVSSAQRDAFNARPLTQAVREVARNADWQVTVRFFRAISNQAKTEDDYILVSDLAREVGRRDLAVIAGLSASENGFGNFQKIAFPLIPTPVGTNWTVIHAITRQESQFAQNAMSHAGARGLMQLMPATAREQAGKAGLAYNQDALVRDTAYNLRLGEGYFQRMLNYYNGSYPLAVASYNAGAGNVNKWLKANGDPRTGAVDWITWIEKIPFFETKFYVQRVLENAVVYEAMNPEKSRYRGPNPLSHILGKKVPG